MEAHRTSRRWTYGEFARLPGPGDDGRRREIIAGELVVSPAPRTRHQMVVSRLTRLLGDFVENHDLGFVLPGPIDVLFAIGDYLEPDLAFVRKDRREIISGRGIEAAPDLVIEIVSASTAERDRGIKRERYAHYGVPEYWVVDPERRSIERYRLAEEPERPARVSGTLRWQPAPDAPTLAIDVATVTRRIEP